MRYIIAPLDFSIEEREVYWLLYNRMNFETQLVKYTLDQLVSDSDQRLYLSKDKINRIVKNFIKEGYIDIYQRGSKGNPTTYKVIKYNDLLQTQTISKQTQTKHKPNLNKQITTDIEGFEGDRQTNTKLKPNLNKQIPNTNPTPIKEKDKEKENDNINNKKKNELEIEIESYTTNQDLRETFIDFLKMRKSIKKPMTLKALKLLMNKLNKMSKNDYHKIQILEQSIMYSWQGVFDLKEDIYGKPKQDNKPSSSEEYNFDKYTG